MHFSHHPEIRRQYPELAAGVLFARGIHTAVSAGPQIEHHEAAARSRLATCSESELPEIQAWRRAFSRMGLKPTQYRCASESLLRRLKKEGSMPRIHPLIDVCNAISMAFAVPVAVLDVSRISQSLQVRHAQGSERYLSFAGEIEHPEPGEVTFVDADDNAHARRWSNRQSGLSAVRDSTTDVLIVAEAMHAGGQEDIARLVEVIAATLRDVWSTDAQRTLLTPQSPKFDFG